MKQFITIALLLVAMTTNAQVRLEGVVKDSIGDALELANVVAINQETKALESYGITNDQGRFKLSLEKNTSYKIQVSYIGMVTSEDLIDTKEDNITKNYILQNDNALDEVELIYEMPVTIKGDTIVYNADSFKTGTERKLGDVLKKLPGVEINDDGQIEVEGKVVSKVMVEGKDFFDGDSKLATNNIPADAVDKVQVLKNYSNVGQLSGVQNNQDNIAINIKLKEGKDSFWFGTLTAGGGVSDDNSLYLAQPKLFYYSPKYSVNVIGDLNNIGELAFTRRDYFNFSGGFQQPSSRSGTSINLGDNGLNLASLQNNRAKNVNVKFGAANFSYAPSSKLDISGFGIFTGNRIDLEESNLTTYNEPFRDPITNDLIDQEATQSTTHQKSDLGMLKLKTKYKPNGNNQLDYGILGKVSKETEYDNNSSSVTGVIGQVEEATPFSLNQNLNYYYTLNENNIFAVEAQHVLKDEDPFYNAIIEEQARYQTGVGLGLDGTQSNYDLAQNKRVKSNQLDAKVDYWNVLNQKSNINLTLGTIYSNQKFNSNIFQNLDDGSFLNPTSTINNGLDTNDTDYTFSDIYLGVHYRVKVGMFTFTPGFSAHAYNSKNEQYGLNYSDSFFKLLPDLNVIMQLKKSEQIIFNYRMQTQFTDVTNLARGIVLNNYNSIYSGNQFLDNALSHNLNLSYFSFNMFNYTNVFANINYNKSIDQIRNLTNFESVIRTNSPFNSDFADETVSVNGRFQRTFGKFRGTLRSTFNYSKFNQVINGSQSVNENYTQNYNLGFRTNFREAPNVELGYRYVIQDNEQGSTKSKFYTNAPSVEVDALIWKKLTFKSEYSYNSLSDEVGKINSFDFWDASLAYRKNQDAKWEFEVKATNLLDTKAQSNTSNGLNAVSTNNYFIQPRYLSFRVIYSL